MRSLRPAYCLRSRLAARFPGVDVKGAPTAGWFFPAALPGDLADVYPPSDFPHFFAGTHGNFLSEDPGGTAAGDPRAVWDWYLVWQQ